MTTFSTLEAVLADALAALETAERPAPDRSYVTLEPVDDFVSGRFGQMTVALQSTEPAPLSDGLPCLNARQAIIEISLRRPVRTSTEGGDPPSPAAQSADAAALLADLDALNRVAGATGDAEVDAPSGAVAGVSLIIERLIT